MESLKRTLLTSFLFCELFRKKLFNPDLLELVSQYKNTVKAMMIVFFGLKKRTFSTVCKDFLSI